MEDKASARARTDLLNWSGGDFPIIINIIIVRVIIIIIIIINIILRGSQVDQSFEALPSDNQAVCPFQNYHFFCPFVLLKFWVFVFLSLFFLSFIVVVVFLTFCLVDQSFEALPSDNRAVCPLQSYLSSDLSPAP